MRKLVSVAIATALFSGGFALTIAPALAQTKKKQTTKRAPSSSAAMWAAFLNEGGALGCYDPSLTGRARAMAERHGASPCAATRTVRTTSPHPATVSTAWLVGLWVSTSGNCEANDFPTRLRANGRYERSSDSGSWKLANGQITFTYRDTGGEMVSGQQEASLPIRSNVIRVERLGDDRMRMGYVVLQRCSTNPDAPLKLEGF